MWTVYKKLCISVVNTFSAYRPEMQNDITCSNHVLANLKTKKENENELRFKFRSQLYRIQILSRVFKSYNTFIYFFFVAGAKDAFKKNLCAEENPSVGKWVKILHV
jgi:hypothetical protein